MLCTVFSLSYVRALVCVLCGIEYVLCAVCRHEPRRFAPSMPRFVRQGRAQQWPKGRALVGGPRVGPRKGPRANTRPTPQPPLRQRTRSSHVSLTYHAITIELLLYFEYFITLQIQNMFLSCKWHHAINSVGND